MNKQESHVYGYMPNNKSLFSKQYAWLNIWCPRGLELCEDEQLIVVVKPEFTPLIKTTEFNKSAKVFSLHIVGNIFMRDDYMMMDALKIYIR